MTEAQQSKAKEVVDKLNEILKDDEHFDDAWYTWYGRNKVEFAASIKEIPRYKYVTCKMDFDDIDVDEVVSKLQEYWAENTTPKAIKSFIDFITFGEKYGWD